MSQLQFQQTLLAQPERKGRSGLLQLQFQQALLALPGLEGRAVVVAAALFGRSRLLRGGERIAGVAPTPGGGGVQLQFQQTLLAQAGRKGRSGLLQLQLQLQLLFKRAL